MQSYLVSCIHPYVSDRDISDKARTNLQCRGKSNEKLAVQLQKKTVLAVSVCKQQKYVIKLLHFISYISNWIFFLDNVSIYFLN